MHKKQAIIWPAVILLLAALVGRPGTGPDGPTGTGAGKSGGGQPLDAV